MLIFDPRMISTFKRSALLLAAAGVLFFQLIVPPSVGLASNGDFTKIIGIFNLRAPVEDENVYADIHYRIHPDFHFESGLYSSETALVAVAVALNRWFSETFDLRWIGAVHAALFLLAYYLLQPLIRSAVLACAIVFIFCDAMYASWLNSFYMDTATYLFLLLALVFFLRAAAWRRKIDAIGFVLCSVLMIVAKTQHAIFGVWIALLCACCGTRLWSRRFAVRSTVTVLVATLAVLMTAPRDYPAMGYFSVIFYQILPHSSDPAGDLKALGLDESYLKWSGTYAFSEGNQLGNAQFFKAFTSRTGYGRLGWFFLTHPRAAYLALDVSLAEGARQRPFLGNFDRAVGRPPFAESHAFSLWSDAKKWLFYQHGTRYLCWWAIVLASFCSLLVWRRAALSVEQLLGGLALVSVAVTALLVASLADAVDVPRHHFMDNALLDLLLIGCLALGVQTGNPKPSSVKC